MSLLVRGEGQGQGRHAVGIGFAAESGGKSVVRGPSGPCPPLPPGAQHPSAQLPTCPEFEFDLSCNCGGV